MRIALMATCMTEALAPAVPAATVRLLTRLGHRVDFPQDQACCGQMHINSGYHAEALPVIRHHVATFERALDKADAVVAPASACVASMQHHHGWVGRLAGDDALAHRAQAVADKTYDLATFLVDVAQTVNVGAYFPHRVTYHPSCHGLRALRLGDKPLQLLRAVDGLELLDLPDAETCCGFGGTFSLKNHATSGAMVKDKAANVVTSSAAMVVGVDMTCLTNIGGALSRAGAAVKPVHLAQVLASTGVSTGRLVGTP